ncbi:MAG: ATP-binding protein [Candidatus Micrarchaeia archaeon]
MDSSEKDKFVRVGTALVSHLSDAFYDNNVRVFEEYIVNASDALARKVDIKISSSFIEIKDDGQGMNPSELKRFFFIAHSDKKAGEFKNIGRGKSAISRQIIGQFGLGKLSAYRLADKLTIISWKDGAESSASLSFTELRQKDYLDEFEMNVATKKSSHPNGTLVEMSNLKRKIYVPPLIKQLTAELPRRLTIRDDLDILVNETKLQREKIKGTYVDINEIDAELGEIHGTLIYSDEPMYADAGIFIRVYGRVINHPRLLHELANVTGANSLAARTFLDVTIDSLADAVLANRNGFNEEHELFKTLKKWVQRTLNRNNRLEMESRREDGEKIHQTSLLLTLGQRLSSEKMRVGEDKRTKSLPSPARRRIKDRAKVLKEIEELSKNKENFSINFKGKRFTFKIEEAGENQNEWRFDRASGTIFINSSHPLFREAVRRKAEDIYSVKSVIVAISVEVSKNLDEFRDNYEQLTRIAAKNIT